MTPRRRSNAMHRLPSTTPPRKRGFTYVEATFSVIVLGLATVGSLELYGGYLRGARIQEEQTLAQELAADLMAEALNRGFEEPDSAPGSFGVEAGEADRRTFDDVDDYDGWVETPPKNRNGSTINASAYAAYSRTVEVFNVDEADFVTRAADGATAAKAVRVTVTVNGVERASLTSHVAR